MQASSIPILAAFVVLVAACDRQSDEQPQLAAAKTNAPPAAENKAPSDAEASGLAKRIAQVEADARLAGRDAKLDAKVEAVPPVPSAVPPARPGEPDPTATYRIPIGESHTRGPDTALVTVLVWSDFECPHCGRVEPLLEDIEGAFGSDVRFAFKHCPLTFHARAKPAAIAAEAAAEQGKFWEMHDKLFENVSDLSDENFVVWAREIGLDVKRFQRDLGDATLERRVQSQRDECSTFGLAGVPTFHVNGRYVDFGAFEGLEPVIQEEKREAEALVAAGTSREGIYDAVIATGKTGV